MTDFWGNYSKEITLQGWVEKTPDDFWFTVKGSRYITHMKKLKDMKESVAQFMKTKEPLGDKLKCVLWQLPGNQHKDVEKLDKFCSWLSKEVVNTIEFRHNSWFDEAVYEVLRKHGITFCIISTPTDLREDAIETADAAYVRFHGTSNWYKHYYTDDELQEWVDKIKSLKARETLIYFNNDVDMNAIENARTLEKMLK